MKFAIQQYTNIDNLDKDWAKGLPQNLKNIFLRAERAKRAERVYLIFRSVFNCPARCRSKGADVENGYESKRYQIIAGPRVLKRPGRGWKRKQTEAWGKNIHIRQYFSLCKLSYKTDFKIFLFLLESYVFYIIFFCFHSTKRALNKAFFNKKQQKMGQQVKLQKTKGKCVSWKCF